MCSPCGFGPIVPQKLSHQQDVFRAAEICGAGALDVQPSGPRLVFPGYRADGSPGASRPPQPSLIKGSPGCPEPPVLSSKTNPIPFGVVVVRPCPFLPFAGGSSGPPSGGLLSSSCCPWTEDDEGVFPFSFPFPLTLTFSFTFSFTGTFTCSLTAGFAETPAANPAFAVFAGCRAAKAAFAAFRKNRPLPFAGAGWPHRHWVFQCQAQAAGRCSFGEKAIENASRCRVVRLRPCPFLSFAGRQRRPAVRRFIKQQLLPMDRDRNRDRNRNKYRYSLICLHQPSKRSICLICLGLLETAIIPAKTKNPP